MTFDEWVSAEFAIDNDDSKFEFRLAKRAWDAATKSEREECARVADARAMRCERKAPLAEDADEVTELYSLTWQFSVLAAEMRKRSNVKWTPF